MTQPIFVAEDNLVRLDRLRLSSTGAYVNAGTVTYALKDAAGNVVSSGSLAYVAGTHGRWQGAIDRADVAGLTVGAPYWLDVTIDNGAGADGFRRVECVARYDAEGD